MQARVLHVEWKLVYSGGNLRLTDVAGRVVKDIVA